MPLYIHNLVGIITMTIVGEAPFRCVFCIYAWPINFGFKFYPLRYFAKLTYNQPVFAVAICGSVVWSPETVFVACYLNGYTRHTWSIAVTAISNNARNSNMGTI